MTLRFSQNDVDRLEEALKKIGRITERGNFTYKDMDVVRDFCAEALGSFDFSEARLASQSERVLDMVSGGDPKVKAYLLAQATKIVHDVEMDVRNGKVSGFVTYMAGNLGAIHAGLRKMESERGVPPANEREVLLRKICDLQIQLDAAVGTLEHMKARKQEEDNGPKYKSVL